MHAQYLHHTLGLLTECNLGLLYISLNKAQDLIPGSINKHLTMDLTAINFQIKILTVAHVADVLCKRIWLNRSINQIISFPILVIFLHSVNTFKFIPLCEKHLV